MNRDRVVRGALWASVPVNLGGALVFLFPGSAAGRLAGLPSGAPLVYRATVAFFVLLFGGAYFWLATRRPVIDRPMVALSAIGKCSFFVLATILCASGELPGRALAATVPDAVLGAIWAWWLWGGRSS
jgi:hypothetical protein